VNPQADLFARDGVGSDREVEMREIASPALAALILIGVGSFGSDVLTIRQAIADSEAGINTIVVPVVPDGIDPFGLMVSAREICLRRTMTNHIW
jgi:hypothetical protein